MKFTILSSSSLFIIFLFLILFSAAPALSESLYEKACSLTVQDANICLTLLKSDSRIISTTNYDDLSKYILELAVKESNAVQDYMVNLASVYFSDLAIRECAQQIYPKIIEAFKRALGEFDKDPQSAKNNIKAAGNGPGDCEKVIQNEGKHKDLSTKDQNSKIFVISEVAFISVNQLT